ncbi:hypothetical protein OS493_009232 [Desmophyllum pertusum]|uniref:Peroxidase n=1 Tax=Desmophyllum pertusum TaxID=174260 RepID=A0A9W9Z2G4_9CNID|nr:hypothetical protein OS493_009232 [Desmophyllum pertusum]
MMQIRLLIGVAACSVFHGAVSVIHSSHLLECIPPCKAIQLCQDLQSPQYRTITGECNNLGKSQLGAAKTPFRRLISNGYQDGISKPRQESNDGVPLPNARTISRTLFPQSEYPDSSPWEQSPSSDERTNMASVFGQFLTHDITLAWHGGANQTAQASASRLIQIALEFRSTTPTQYLLRIVFQ